MTLVPDLYGYGGSDAWPGRRPIRLADEAAIVESLAGALDGPIHLVGHSYGGAVALKVALRRRIPLRSLTLVEPVAFNVLRNGDPWGETYSGEIGEVADFVRSAVSAGDPAAAMNRFVDYWNGTGTWSRLTPDQQDRLMRAAPKLPHDFRAATFERSGLQYYAEIEAPSLLLCGTDSPAPTRRIASLLDLTIPDCRLVVMTGAGHMMPLTHAGPVNAAIAGHLHQHRAVSRQAA